MAEGGRGDTGDPRNPERDKGVKIDLKKILCPVDFSSNAAYATRYALAFAETYRAELILLQVEDSYAPCIPADYPGIDGISPTGMPEAVDECDENDGDDTAEKEESLERLAADLHETHRDVKITPLRATGKPFVEIVRMAGKHDVDLIVLGTHGRTGLAHMLIGSTAEKVVRMAPCPVMTIKHPEHEFVMP